MIEGRQADEWARATAIIATIGNIFADKDSRVPILDLMPGHLVRKSPKKQPREETPEQVQASWAALRAAFQSGRIRQKG